MPSDWRMLLGTAVGAGTAVFGGVLVGEESGVFWSANVAGGVDTAGEAGWQAASRTNKIRSANPFRIDPEVSMLILLNTENRVHSD